MGSALLYILSRLTKTSDFVCPPLPPLSVVSSFPAWTAFRTPAHLGIPYMAPLLRTRDGVNLTCYLVAHTQSSLDAVAAGTPLQETEITDERIELTEAAGEAAATVILFHGNAMHNWEDMESPADLFKMGCNVFLPSYRG